MATRDFMQSREYWEQHSGFRGWSAHEVAAELFAQALDRPGDVIAAIQPRHRNCLVVPVEVSMTDTRRNYYTVRSAEIDWSYVSVQDEEARRRLIQQFDDAITGKPSLTITQPSPLARGGGTPAISYTGGGGGGGHAVVDIPDHRALEKIVTRLFDAQRQSLETLKAEIIQQVSDEIQSIVAEIRDERR